MGKKRALLLIASAGVIVVFVLWQMSRSDEPRFEGKRLGTWLADLDLGVAEPSSKAAEAVRAIRAIGTNSFPWLLKMIRADEPIWKQIAVEFNYRQSLIRLPVLPASVTRARALEGYRVLGPVAIDAVPGLIELLDPKNVPPVRAYAASALGKIGLGARAAIPSLQQAASDSNPEVSKSARLALANIQTWSEPNFERKF